MRKVTVSFSWIAAALWLSCGDGVPAASPEYSYILATLQNLPTRTASVVVSATLDGKPGDHADAYSPPPSDGRFAVRQPFSAAGNLQVFVTALDADQCSVGSGSLAATLPQSKVLETNLALSAVSPRNCWTIAPCAVGTICPDTSPATSPIRGMWAIASHDVWAVGDAGLLLHYDGRAWTATPPPGGLTKNLNAVWASAAGDVWAVGAGGTVLHYNGTTWASSTVGTADLKGIWGSSASEIWAAGEISATNYIILRHWTGTSWFSVDTGIMAMSGTVNAVWTSAPDFVYLAGSDSTGGLLVRWNGSSWNRVIANTTQTLRAIWGTGRANLVAVGDAGAFLRYEDAAGWQNVSSSFASTANLYAVAGGQGQDTIAVGDNGTVIRAIHPYNPANFSIFSLAGKFLRAAAVSPSGIVWLGGTSSFLGHIDLRP